jgi:hypothetical protein
MAYIVYGGGERARQSMCDGMNVKRRSYLVEQTVSPARYASRVTSEGLLRPAVRSVPVPV